MFCMHLVCSPWPSSDAGLALEAARLGIAPIAHNDDD